MLDPPWGRPLQGRLDEHVITSDALRGNALGDPVQRPLWVYTPPGYDAAPDRRYPAVYVIQGFTGQLDMWRNRNPMRPLFTEEVDALFSDGETPQCLVCFVDCWTSLGGSQFVDSPATGRYHTYLCDEVVPWVDAHYHTLAAAAHRGIAGKSSGGYGAMITPMLRPDLWGGLATHAGDALFEACYARDFAPCARLLRDDYQGSFDRFLAGFRGRPAFTRDGDDLLLNAYAMAACYSADADGTVRLPFDPTTGALVPGVWERWLAWDPVRMVPGHADALRSLRAIYIDAGVGDEFYLDLGAEAFRSALAAVGVTDVHFELFAGTHMNIGYRYPIALRYLAERLAA
ncbi:MAG TPA: alpha/beta hydrolase-fold protein [Gaiellales bacterium]|jgi:S-formylglutathione hydrolase FrmB